MGSLIWFIIVGIIVYRVVIKKEREQKKNSGGQPQTTVMPERRPSDRGSRTMQGAERHAAQNTGKQHTAQRQDDLANAAGGSGSTMEYLNEKARQDAIEHAKDKREEMERLHKNYGGLRVAGRLYDGDTVPNGSRCVVCGYCGAENLVPMIAREKYSCYFCREPL